jgi:hypothetical protein
MKQTSSQSKYPSTPVEPVIISRLQRATATEIARQQARAAIRQRVTRILLSAVAAAVGLRVLTIALQPCLAAGRSARHIRLLRAQLQREEERRQHLTAQISYLKGDQGVEEEARKLGWTRAGEISLELITPEPKVAGKAGAQSDAAAPGSRLPVHISGSERFRLWLTRLIEHRK